MCCACAAGGRVTLAPHLTREAELGPAAAAGNYTAVIDKAGVYETQNPSSRDVHWYRAWRAGAMIGLGQIDEASALVEQLLTDLPTAQPAPAQADRLRVFAFDLRAKIALAQNRPQDALAALDTAFKLAADADLESSGECDRPLMMAARAKQLASVASAAGSVERAENAQSAYGRQLHLWSTCLVQHDYPGMSVVAVLASPERASPEVAARAAPEGERTVKAQYAPIDPAPWKKALEAAQPLLAKQVANVKSDIVIRTDGQHHALRLRVSLPRSKGVEDLVPLFRATVLFFEQARAVEPKVERVLVVVESGNNVSQVLAGRGEILELFQDRLDAATFAKRLTRVM